MKKIIECVPNFSTSDQYIINEITSAISSVKGARLLNVEPDNDYNRVVITFVGSPDIIGEAAFMGISKATELIDMSQHKGEHPRMGACDVTPFIPVRGVSEEECTKISKELARRIAEELGVPTYLYGKSATRDERIKLSNIRKGQYEGFSEKIQDPEWKPDYGDVKFNVKSGVYAIGVRDFLIAYNVNLDTEEVSVAKEVGELIRESGRLVEKDGEKVRVPGQLKGIQGMGFPLERDGRKLTQVSMNVVDFRNQTKPHEAFELVKKLAEERGSKVTGSEIVGLVPLDAILEAGKFYTPEVNDQIKLVETAIERLGLSDLEEFNPSKKIIELMIDQDLLIDFNVDQFLNKLASDKPAPGGGSVSALGGALAGSLGSMVSRLSIGKEKYKENDELLKETLVKMEEKVNFLKTSIDEDTKAFNEVMNAFKFPKDDPEIRSKKIQVAMKYAAEVPLQVSESCFELLDLLFIVAEKGNKNAVTDIGVGALFANAAIQGALYNVKINLMSIKDENVKVTMKERISSILSKLDEKSNSIRKIVEEELA